MSAHSYSHLKILEAESVYIFREVAASFQRPVMLYSVGKDSSVLLHLARKAFYPGSIPFPLVHIDTGWKFKEMISFRDRTAKEIGFELIVHTNKAATIQGVNPFDSGTSYTDIMKTEALKEILGELSVDCAIGGARRDEEKSRAKERIFSVRTGAQRWDPKNQRPELWDLFNTCIGKGQSMRAFPLSNWTEEDVWQYILKEGIPVVPLYFAKPRPVVKRDDMLIMVDDDRFPLHANEIVQTKSVRFRTLGCYPLTGAVESHAQNIEDILDELTSMESTERSGRAIDKDATASMEKKKMEGYF